MFMSKLLFCTLIFTLANASPSTSNSDDTKESKLVMTQIVWRHGDRSPTAVTPNDPNKDWPQGFGQLTTRGMAEQYKLGQNIKKRYMGSSMTWWNNTALSPTYVKKQMYVRSDSENRCLMSAYSNLVGMFTESNDMTAPPSTNGQWPKMYSPVPVHSVVSKYDRMLSTGADCDKIYEIEGQQFTSTYFKELNAANADLFSMLTNRTGQKVISVWELSGIYDAAYIERYWDNTDGYTTTEMEWVNETVSFVLGECPGNTTVGVNMTDTMTVSTKVMPTCVHTNVSAFEAVSILNFATSQYYEGMGNSTQSVTLARLFGGVLLKTIQEAATTKWSCTMNAKLSMTDNCTRHSFNDETSLDLNDMLYIAYSAHDTTVDSLLKTLQDADTVIGIDASGLPKYAAAVAVELWAERASSKADWSPVLRLQYHDGQYFENTDMNGEQWRSITNTVTGCPATDGCPWATFVKRNMPFMPIPGECSPTKTPSKKTTCNNDDGNTAAVVFAILFGVMTAVFGALAALFYMRSRK